MINYNDEEKDKVVGSQDEQPDNVKKVETTTTTKKENNSQVAVNNYQMTPFTAQMEAEALKAAEESSAFKSLMQKRKERMGEHGKRAQSAEDAAKALAWTNLFANLAKIAGMGKAPVVQENTGFMDRAFAEADALRKSYYAKDDEYENMLDKYKTSYVDAARAAHNKSELEKYKAEGQRVKDLNRLNLEKTTTTTTKTVADPYKEADDARKQAKHEWEERMLPLQEEKLKAQTEASKASATASKARADKAANGDDDALYIYPHSDGNSYTITESDGLIIKQRLLDTLQGKDNTTKESYTLKRDLLNRKLKSELEGDIAILDQALDYGSQKRALADVVNKYLNRYPDLFQDVLDRSKRTKTRSNSPAETQAPEIKPIDVTTLIK